MPELTTDPDDPRLGHGVDVQPGPPHEAYLVLPAEVREGVFLRLLRDKYVHLACSQKTRISIEMAETFARDPKFYDVVYCSYCRMHRPVSEFVWSFDGFEVGSL